MPNFAIKLNKTIVAGFMCFCGQGNISNGCFKYSHSLRVSEANEVPVCSDIGSLDDIQTALKSFKKIGIIGIHFMTIL